MKKEDLIQLGLTEEQAEKVVKLHSEELDGSFVPKSRFNEVNEENKSLKQTVSERDKQLEDLSKTAGDSEELKKQIETLKTANSEALKKHEKEMAQLRLDNAIDSALASAGARNVRAVRGLIDASGFKLSDKGEVAGLSEAIEAVKQSDGYLFVSPDNQSFKGFQPGESQGSPSEQVDTSKMTYSETVAYLAANPGATI